MKFVTHFTIYYFSHHSLECDTLFVMYMHSLHNLLPIKSKVCNQWATDSVQWLQTKAAAGGYKVTDVLKYKIKGVVGA